MRSLSATAKRLLPRVLVDPVRSLYHSGFRATLRMRFAVLERFERQSYRGMPIPPASLRYRVSETLSIGEFLWVGEASANSLERALSSAEFLFSRGQQVLDFGCGCGRTLAWLSRRYPSTSWFGVDTDEEAVRWCRENLRAAGFSTNQRQPPLPFPKESLDLIYAISVFTHLDEPDQAAWLEEFERVLKPGGLILLTFYSASVWSSLEEAPGIREGAFHFRRSRKLHGIHPEWYHTAFQNAERLASSLRRHFLNVQHVPEGLGSHDIVIARKRLLLPKKTT